MNDIEIYIHIPFCARKCAYCDFVSFPAGRDAQDEYVNALINEISAKSVLAKNRTVRSVFIGGGTPSLLDEAHIRNIMNVLREGYDIRKNAEITIESNPCTIMREKLDSYLGSGINRISIGCQSTDNKNLKILGRLHDFETFMKSYEETLCAGFKNINVDMMYALPDQSVSEWESELKIISSLNISHISAYSLILEEGTPLYKISDTLSFPDDDEAAQMYESTDKILSSSGFGRYEISNYARSGLECIHNVGYWERVPYLGFGIAAASLLDREEDIVSARKKSSYGIRSVNTSDMEKYLKVFGGKDVLNQSDIMCEAAENVSTMTKADAMSEFMFLGMRMTKGVSRTVFQDEFGCDMFEVFGTQLNRNIKIGALECVGDRIFIPKKYLFVSNQILSDFV